MAWLRYLTPARTDEVLLVCFPPTGGSPVSFHAWRNLLAQGTALAAVELPGRGDRIAERPVTEPAAVAGAVAAEVTAALDERPGTELVLVGVSLGGLLAYETCRALRRDGIEVARLCVISVAPASRLRPVPGTRSADEVRSILADWGLTAPELLAHPEFDELYLPVCQADLALSDRYDGRLAAPVDVPITAVAGTEDTIVAADAMRGWQELTTAGFRYRSLPGSHLLHETHATEVVREVVTGHGEGGSGLSRRRMLRLGVTAGGVGLLGARGGAGATASAAPAVTAVSDPTDPVELARLMIRFDTSHLGEGGVTLPYAKAMRDIWQAAGVPAEIVPTPKPDNVHFLARVAGSGGSTPPLLVLGHSDVVTAGGEQWNVDPYGGVIADGFLYGRGALDMKGANAAFMSALLRHLRAGARFDRDIIYLADCDEEGGPYGTAWLVEQHWAKVAAGAVLTEGGWLINHPDGSPMLASLVCADKRSVVVELVAQARATHSTKPYPGMAITRIAKAIELMQNFHTPVNPNALAKKYFTALAAGTRDPAFAAAIRQMLAARDQRTRDDAGAEVVKRSDYPHLHNALMRSTVSFVSAGAGYYSSIIPGRATAQARVGFLPGGDDPVQTIADLRRLAAKADVQLRVLGATGQSEQEAIDTLLRNLAIPPSTADTDVFRFWADAVGTVYPNVTTTAGQFEASTSGNPWRSRGIPVYGIYPYALDNESINRMHGVDERVGVAQLRQGTELLYRMFERMKVS
ncbi:M20/M25/M40 family metallo-hydrolase [Amycolatopsis samaneae]|uniref:M20/M25/M40 family metallo-hydrolase n=1 Tax=Amycolatopsis samaneae TaxID=664691 RepID=A0ABW5GXR1_9PSEU